MNVLVIHEEPIVAAGLVAVLEEQIDCFATRSRSTLEFLSGGAGRLSGFDVVVADFRAGIELVAEIKKCCDTEGPRVMIVTQVAREWEVRFAVNAGVFGIVLQGCELESILAGVRMVAANRRYMCEDVAERIAESLTRASLTGRETEVLELLQQGLCNKTIARQLGVAPGTIKAHVRGILEKLGSSTRTQAVAVATHRGLIRAGTISPPQMDAAIHPSKSNSELSHVGFQSV